MATRRSSGAWKQRQESDPYVKMARRDGWRSRAVYKLEQIDQKERILRPDMTCVDLGAAPGSWSQYVTERLAGSVRIVALDILEMDSLPSVEFIQGASDFRFAFVQRNNKNIGYASWGLREGEWTLFSSSWQESSLPTPHGRKAESPSG